MSDMSIASPFLGMSDAIRLLSHFGRAVLRVGGADVAKVSEHLGFDLPTTACRAASGLQLNALWLGPDEWLLMSEKSLASSTGWSNGIAKRLADIPCSLVDVSHRQVALEILGPCAENILSHGCALDLALSAFPVGMCTRTMYDKAEIILWRTASDRFHVEVWRSFARYTEALLREAENEA